MQVVIFVERLRVVHLGRSTCHAISGRGDKSTKALFPRRKVLHGTLMTTAARCPLSPLGARNLDGPASGSHGPASGSSDYKVRPWSFSPNFVDAMTCRQQLYTHLILGHCADNFTHS